MGALGDIAIYGQESNNTTWRLAKMNLAVRGIDADIRWNNEGSFHKDELPDLKADFHPRQFRRLTSPIGAATGCGTTLVGSSVYPQWVTLTTGGFSTSTIISPRMEGRA